MSASPPPANVTATGRPTVADVPFGKPSTGSCGLAIAATSASPTTRSHTRTSSTPPAHQSVGAPAHLPRPPTRFPGALNAPAGPPAVAPRGALSDSLAGGGSERGAPARGGLTPEGGRRGA